MSKHNMPKGSKSAEATDVPEATEAAEATEVTEPTEATEATEVTESTAVDQADAPTETAGESTEDAAEETTAEPTEDAGEASEPAAKRRVNWSRVVAYGILPGLALVLAMTAGFLKWQDNSVRNAEVARTESVQAAKDSTIAMLSYNADTVEQQLTAARELLTGEFRDSYTSLINDVVIPGAKQQKISAVATVPAAASVSADPNNAEVLVFVNQTVVIDQAAPTDTASSVRVGLEKVGDRWLISTFEPV